MTQSEDNSLFAFTITDDHAGARLDKWLSEQIESLTRTRIKALIEGGSLTKDGAAFTDPSWKLRIDEEIQLTVPPVAAAVPKPENIPLDVAFEDDDIIVVNKPAGMVVHPAAGNWHGTLVNALIAHCGDSLSGVGGVARPGIVHRIDKETSGLLVVAKHDRAHQVLTKAFAAHKMTRVYQAIVVGAPRPGMGTIDTAIARADGDRKKFAAVKDGDRPGARHATTHFKLLNAYGRSRAKLKGDAVASLLECRLETGRTHQIRVHLSSIGHPLIGDPVYGRGPGLSGIKPGDDEAEKALHVLKKFRRQALHAKTLGFKHPITREEMMFEAEDPKDFQNLKLVLEAL